MKYIFRSFVFVFVFMVVSSCLNDDDRIGSSYYNTISYDGFRTDLRYARLNLIKTDPFGELYQLVLYENYRPLGWSNSEAVLYLEFYNTRGYPLEGNYTMGSTIKGLDYASYFEGVRLLDGNVDRYEFRLDDSSFRSGYLRISELFANRGKITVQLLTNDGRRVDATYYGYLD